ncbi:TPA: LytR/AlgR family response regulator transcription factor [Elizabethkingia anophelis]
MDKLKCIIVDDDESAHVILKSYLDKLNTISLEASFYNAIDALDYLSLNYVNLIFLDVNMPLISGFEMLETLSFRPDIILTTGHKDFAFESYNYDIIDYLLKPYSFKRFMSAINKVWNKRAISQQLEHPKLKVQYINIKVAGDIIKLDLKEVLYIQSYGNYIKIFTTNNIFITQITTTEIEKNLQKDFFLRIHKSYIVSVNRINKVSGGRVFIDGDIELPIGSLYKRELLSKFGKT